MKAWKILGGLLGIGMLLTEASFAINGLQLIGNSAIQKSMGGAGSAMPQDSLSILMNPAGMSQLTLRNDVFMDEIVPDSSYRATTDFTPVFLQLQTLAQDPNTPPEVLAEIVAISEQSAGVSPVSEYELSSQARSVLIPGLGSVFHRGKKLSLGFAAAGVAGVSADYKQGIYGNVIHENFAVLRFATGASYQLNPKLSLGAAFNLSHATLSFEMGNFASHNADSQFGTGFQLGALYEASKKVSLSVAYISLQDITPFKFNTAPPQRSALTTAINGPSTGAQQDELDLDLPANILLGLAYHHNDRLSVAFDIRQIQWSETMGEKLPEGEGLLDSAFNADWSDQTVMALGIQYQATPKLAFRAGYNHGKMPHNKDRAFENIAISTISETHYTLGGGYQFSKTGALHLVYMQSPEASVSGDNAEQLISDYESTLSVQSLGMQLSQNF